jgi:hypothetical protein
MGGAISRVTKLLAAMSLLMVLGIGSRAAAAEKTLSWWYDECDYSVSFDPAQHDEALLRNTVHLLYGPPDFKAPLLGLPFNPQSIDRLSLDHTSRECRSAVDVANRLEFVALTGIDDYRRALIAQIEDTCQFETVEIRSFRDPSALREYGRAAACAPFVDALEGKSDVMAVFRQTLDQRCGGAESAQCAERELSRSHKADGMDWVRLYLTKVGWNTCASEFTSRNTDGKRLEQMRAELEEQFRRTFNVTRNKCDLRADSRSEFRSTAMPLAGTTPDKPASSTGKPRRLHCGVATSRRHRSERASCAAARTPHRAASRSSELPTPFAANLMMRDFRPGRR